MVHAPRAYPPGRGRHPRFAQEPLHDELPEDDSLEELTKVGADLGQHADGEQAEHRAGRAQGHRRRRTHAEQTPRGFGQHDVAREPRADPREQVREPHAERALLLLDDFAKDVEEEDVAAEVRPVGVAEDAGDELPPVRVHVIEVQRLDESHVQPLVGDEERDVDEQEEENAVALVGR